ncbi:ubiquitin-specific protease otu1 [Yamadazyma tenuis]|uniref:Ubiquitin thioesterase OTU n=1 Tax=Candida tenuis (strain ATCC 10573 / BCRC 21748 / CBS 615 / JCM 9827 / NBRC 10315 / NRRL Y-1498 / VKM Y-70) TaxID=590646 RepID=G3BFS1_CANTC|nr:OTU-domain-containing protein [Yamadazyma tenuis ATCC 10573]EGV60719.1 OTU-domain-containing protein [Yamadazyma tenuis ATCC 10573]WEJ94016.1 ubiquitin-specific protease otu1 [Yamadazyma tenuis]
MRIKVKTPTKVKVLTIDDNLTESQLLEELHADTELFPGLSKISTIKTGFPPKPLSIPPSETIRKYIHNGDQLLIEVGDEKSPESRENPISKEVNDDIPNVHIGELNQYLILRNIKDDNSCMFNAIGYATKTDSATEMRAVCASYIMSDPDKFDEVTLGRSNDDYCSWITKKDSWGGAIELGILSDYYKVRINCIDIESGNIIKFENEDSPPSSFINLVYSGIHYDVLSANPILSTSEKDKDIDTSLWQRGSPEETPIMKAAESLCKLLQTKNYTTNTTRFRIRCLECYDVLVGETGAAKHANEKGHFRFGEV